MGMLIDYDSHVTYAHMIIIYTLHRAKALFPPVGWGLIPASLASLSPVPALLTLESQFYTPISYAHVLFTFYQFTMNNPNFLEFRLFLRKVFQKFE